MKQKAVLRVSMVSKKKSMFRDCWGFGGQISAGENGIRSKALKVVVGAPGVESVAVKGQEKNEIEVTGDDIDVVKLTTLLRKKVGYTKVVSVVEVKKDPAPKSDKPAQPKIGPPPNQQVWNPPPYYISYPYVPEPHYCSIL